MCNAEVAKLCRTWMYGSTKTSSRAGDCRASQVLPVGARRQIRRVASAQPADPRDRAHEQTGLLRHGEPVRQRAGGSDLPSCLGSLVTSKLQGTVTTPHVSCPYR
jgi:hypothetical protein